MNIRDYQDVTDEGVETITSSVQVLEYKQDEKVYIRPVYERDHASPHYFAGAKFVMVDDNH